MKDGDDLLHISSPYCWTMRLGCLVLLLAAVPACAQETPPCPSITAETPASALPLLRSASPCDRAWGAYLVGKYGLKEDAQDLVTELRRLRPSESSSDFGGREGVSLVQTLLDALIQLHHPVEPAALLPFRRRFGPEVLILLADAGQTSRAALLSLLDEDLPCEQWLTVNNLLAEMRAAGFAGRLLQAVRFRVTVAVHDPGQGAGYGSGEGGGASWDGFTAHARGYPPAAIYRLTDHQTPGDAMLAAGSTPIYYRRLVVLTNQALVYGLSYVSCDRQRERENYLGSLAAQESDEIRNTFKLTANVLWLGAEDYGARVGEATSAQAQRILALVDKLTRDRLLSPEERSALRLVIQVQQEDRRKGGGDPLPPVHDMPVALP